MNTEVITTTSVDTPVEVDETRDALSELHNKLMFLNSSANTIARLHSEKTFQFISKESRNVILTNLLDRLEEVDALTKTVYKKMKKIKRVKVPESVTDELFGAPRVQND